MMRRVEPELLDHLPPDDPRAVRSRRDLQRINAWMRNSRIMTAALCSAFQNTKPRTLIELGAGDGTFLLGLAQGPAPAWPDVNVILVDQQNIVTASTRDAFAKLGWRVETVQADVFDWLKNRGAQTSDAILANLFLHHFSAVQLSTLFSHVTQQTRVFIAIDPRRWAWSILACRFLWLIGCNAVTRHDAIASVRAGFANKDLSQLWPADNSWDLREQPMNLASHLFVAKRAANS